MLQVRRRGRAERHADDRRHPEWAPLPGEAASFGPPDERRRGDADAGASPLGQQPPALTAPSDRAHAAPTGESGAADPAGGAAARMGAELATSGMGAAPADAPVAVDAELVAPATIEAALAAARDAHAAGAGRPEPAVTETAIPVEIVAPHLRVEAVVRMRGFERLSDMLNLADELTVEDAVLLDSRGRRLAVRLGRLRVNRNLVCLLAQRRTPSTRNVHHSFYVQKHPTRVVVLAQHHLVIGDAHVPDGGSVATYMESVDPRFMPLTSARVRLLADARHASRFDLVLLNRREILGWSPISHDEESVEAWESVALGARHVADGDVAADGAALGLE